MPERTGGLGWIKAAGECFPKLKFKGLETLRAKLDGLGADVRWTGGVGSGERFGRVGVRCGGRGKDCGAWAKAAGKVLGLKLPDGLRAGPEELPSLELIWDAKAGKLESASLFSAEPGARRAARWSRSKDGATVKSLVDRSPFSPELFAELGLEAAFTDFARLCPVRELLSESAPAEGGKLEPKSAWALSLREPTPWPSLLRLDVGAPFGADSAQQSFLLLNRKVAELGFTSESMWAWFSD